MVQLSGATYNSSDFENFGHAEITIAGSDGQPRQRWDNMWIDGKAEILQRLSDTQQQQLLATNAALATAADRLAVAADRASVASDRSTTQTLLGQAQSAQTASAASAVLAQQYVGTASNVILPASNYRLASAWDANGNATQYALTNVVAVYRCDARLDWDRGVWRKSKLARASSWWNEALNTSTRGAKREPPVAPLIVATTTQVIIYDQHDLDANASPRMWMVINQTAGAALPLASVTSIFALGGRVWIGVSAAADGMLIEIDFLRDQILQRQDSVNGYVVRGIANRNAVNSRVATQLTAGLVSYKVSGVHARVLPGAPLDPISRLPIPTIAAATAGGTSVIHPTGLIASVTTIGGHARCALTNNELWMYRRTVDDGRGVLYRMSIPYASGLTPTTSYLPGTTPGLLTATAAHTPAFARWSDGWARGGDTGLTIVADDPANPANSMVANVTNAYATGWMPGDTRLCAITEGAGSNGTSGGELVTNGTNLTNTTGWSQRNAATLSAVGGALRVMASSSTSGQGATYSLATTAGVQHTVSFDVVGGGIPPAYYYVDVTDSTEATVLSPTATAGANGVSGIRVSFIATGSVSKLRMFTTSTSGQYVDYANISCRKAGTFSDVITGTAELIVNGDGTTTAGWTAVNGATLSTSGGRIVVARNGADYPGAKQVIATKAGETHSLSFDVLPDTALVAKVEAFDIGGTLLKSATISAATVDSVQFVAMSSQTQIIITPQATSGTQQSSFKKLSCRLALPDRSYKAKGLIPVGTLNRSPVATGSDLYAVSGFSANNYLEQPYNSDMDIGTGDCAWAMWFTGVMSIQRAYYTGSAYSGAIMRLINTGALIRFSVSDGTTQALANAAVAVPGGYHLAVGVLRRATQTVELWLDGVLLISASASAVGSLTNAQATTRVGKEHDGSVWGDSIVLPRFAAYAPTQNQIRKMYADEAPLFQAGAKAFLGGASNSVQSLTLDEDTGLLSVATGDGVDQFAGLRRVGRVAANTQVIGAELISNPGGPFTATTGWSTNAASSLSVVGGELMLTADTSGRSGAITISTVANKRYTVTATLRCGTATRVTPSLLGIADGTAVTATTATMVQFSFAATGASHNFNFYASSAGTAYLTSVSIKEAGAVSTNNATSVAAGGGALLIGTANEAGIVTELMPVKDELRQAAAVANGSDPVLTGVTTDATPLDLGKIFVCEGESVQIEADIQATEYGQTPTEGASYTVRARVRRNLGGNVQLVGSAYHVTVDETTATMDATITVDTTAQAFAINVTGVASKRLIWRAVLRLNWISETRNAAA